jgi:hypothetical protein
MDGQRKCSRGDFRDPPGKRRDEVALGYNPSHTELGRHRSHHPSPTVHFSQDGIDGTYAWNLARLRHDLDVGQSTKHIQVQPVLDLQVRLSRDTNLGIREQKPMLECGLHSLLGKDDAIDFSLKCARRRWRARLTAGCITFSGFKGPLASKSNVYRWNRPMTKNQIHITLISQIAPCPRGHKVGDSWTTD